MTAIQRDSGGHLRQAHRQLVNRGEIPVELLGERLARSWQRSLHAGLQPAGRLDAPHLEALDLRQIQARQRELLAHARPVMEFLHQQVRDTDCLVVLADKQGFLLETLGDGQFLQRAERVALLPGATWNETYRGTNAIGTALAEASAVEIHGAEHYLERNGILTCAAAPIHGPDGHLLGVLDISSDQRVRHPHTLCLSRTAAQMIENRLLDARHRRDIRLRLHATPEGIGSLAEGVLALTEDGLIVGANRTALAALGLHASDIGATTLLQALGLRLGELVDRCGRVDEALGVTDMRGHRHYLRVDVPPRRIIDISPSASVETPVSRQDALSRLDTGDAQMTSAIARARRVLDKPIPLLLLGESGVGKELLAQAVHAAGLRRNKPFVAVNCAALPDTLIEAELFGYAPGAFTGARKEGSPGHIRAADGGTLFLDEIGDMPLAMQGRLLRVLQERQVTPLGGGKPVAVDFALICATHRSLREAAESGHFRQDLYYRINGLTLALPSLRERSDFAALVERMLRDLAPQRPLTLARDLAEALAGYAWPGNLRQLGSALRTAVALLDENETEIGWHCLPDDLLDDLNRVRIHPATPSPTCPASLRALSDQAIADAVQHAHGNMSAAARQLGISRNTLYRRTRQLKRA